MNPFFTFIRENYDTWYNRYYYSGYVGFLNISNTRIPYSQAFIDNELNDDEDCSFEKLYYSGKIKATLDEQLDFDYPLDYDVSNYKSAHTRNTKEIRLTDFPDGYESARVFGFNTNIYNYKNLSYNLVKKETENLKHALMKILK